MRATYALTLCLLATPALAGPGKSPNSGGMAECRVDRDTLATELDACLDDYDELLATCPSPTIDPAFGTTVRSADGRAQLTIPGGAVPTGTDLGVATLTKVDDPTVPPPRAISDVYDAGPDGATFDVDATLCLTVRGDDTEGACLGYLDETTDPPEWKCEDPCVEKTGGGTICGTTDHFTNFAVLLGGGGGEACDDDEPTSWITGGVVTSDDGGAFLSVPPAALPRDTVITVEPAGRDVPDVQRATEVYTFSPAGLRFREPATVCFRASADAAAGNCLGYLDETRSPPQWRCEDPCLDKKEGDLVCGETDHFTNFAILLGGGAEPDECARR